MQSKEEEKKKTQWISYFQFLSFRILLVFARPRCIRISICNKINLIKRGIFDLEIDTKAILLWWKEKKWNEIHEFFFLRGDRWQFSISKSSFSFCSAQATDNSGHLSGGQLMLETIYAYSCMEMICIQHFIIYVRCSVFSIECVFIKLFDLHDVNIQMNLWMWTLIFLSFLVTFDEHKINFVSLLCVLKLFFLSIFSKCFESKWLFGAIWVAMRFAWGYNRSKKLLITRKGSKKQSLSTNEWSKAHKTITLPFDLIWDH